MLKALKTEALRIKGIQKMLANQPLEVAARALMRWVVSRPDLEPVIPIDQLDTSQIQPAGQRVLIDGQEWFLRMQQFHSDGRDWISLPPRPEEITRVNPLEAFPLDAPAEKLLRCCRVVALLQAAAGGNPVEIWQVLKIAGLEEAADFVAKHANGKITWDELLVPSAFPSPRKFLVAAFAGPRHEWHHWVLENLCEGGEDWDQGENPVQVPLPAGSAIKADEGAAEAAAETIKPC